MPASPKRTAAKSSTGKGLLKDPKVTKPSANQNQSRGRGGLQTTSKSVKTKARGWENKNDTTIRNQAESNNIAVNNAVNSKVQEQVDAQNSGSAYDGIEMPQNTKATLPTASDKTTVNNDVYGKSGFDNIVSQQYQNSLNQNQDQWNNQSTDFEQMAAERGWTPGSKVYNDQKAALGKSQASEKANLLSQAQTLGNNLWQTAQSGETSRVSSNLASNDQSFKQGQQLYEDQNTDNANAWSNAKDQLSWQQGQRNEAASDAAVLQGMKDGTYATGQGQSFQNVQNNNANAASNTNASINASGNVRAAGAQAAGAVNVANINNQGASNRQQYAQQTGQQYYN